MKKYLSIILLVLVSIPVQSNEFTEMLELAEQGNAEAQAALGKRYYNGEGVIEDATKGFQWSMKAANQGNVRGQYNVGFGYLSGSGTNYDSEKGIFWFEKAANKDLVLAQMALANFYLEGRIVNKNRSEAVKWLRKAAAAGEADAQSMLDVIVLTKYEWLDDFISHFWDVSKSAPNNIGYLIGRFFIWLLIPYYIYRRYKNKKNGML